MTEILKPASSSVGCANLVYFYDSKVTSIFRGFYYINNQMLLVVSINLLGLMIGKDM